jgi:hypothetical protein
LLPLPFLLLVLLLSLLEGLSSELRCVFLPFSALRVLPAVAAWGFRGHGAVPLFFVGEYRL